MTHTRIIGTAALSLVLLGGAATAAPKPPPKPKPVCEQITDPSGDARIGGSLNAAGQPAYDSLDLLSGDIATGPRNLVGALRVKTTTRDALLVAGSVHELRWKIGEVTYNLYYRVFQSGETEATLHSSAMALGSDLPVTAEVDTATATITWKVSRKLIPELKKTGLKLTELSGYSASGNNLKSPGGTTRGSSGVDTMITTKSYTDLMPTCLKGT